MEMKILKYKNVIIICLAVFILFELFVLANRKIEANMRIKAEEKAKIDEEDKRIKEKEKKIIEEMKVADEGGMPPSYAQDSDNEGMYYFEEFYQLYDKFASYEEAGKCEQSLKEYLKNREEKELYWKISDIYEDKGILGFTITSKQGSMFFVQIEQDKTQIVKVK